MRDTHRRPVVAILNTHTEMIDLLREVLEDEGFTPVTGYVVDFKRGHADISAFLDIHKPRAILFDIAPPYEENWEYFNSVRTLGAIKACAFVVMTTNKSRLEELVGPTDSLAFVGKPFDLNHILSAVKHTIEVC